jgi:hypothetical protein
MPSLTDTESFVRRTTPLLVQCRSAWAPVLTVCTDSITANDRKVNGLLTLMRFASTEPSVCNGEEGRNGFATYDSCRQNWWKLHPTDLHTPVLLGEADRALRNSCRTELPYDSKTNQQIGDPQNSNLTANLAHAIFDALHEDYPQSEWAKRYKSWE